MPLDVVRATETLLADDEAENFVLSRLDTVRDRTATLAWAKPAPGGKASPGPR
jgi:hypothetical protein